jgi:peptidoglycan/xylan/chitin deacetylase (PgdA/CDA1 family)
MKKVNTGTNIPVIMFHSVGKDQSDWVFKHISEPLDLFESKVKALAENRFNTIHWNELYEHMAGRKKLKPGSIMLTFDDGYLDNWVFVFPIIKKYNLKITVFISPEFVDPGLEKRPSLSDGMSPKKPESRGFMNWEEMREMERSGLVDIQSHALTHTWYFSGPDLTAFYSHKDDGFPWMAWNLNPDLKPFYMQKDLSKTVKQGYPVFEHKKSLVCKRFRPSVEILDTLFEHIALNGGDDYFKTENWQKKLAAYYNTVAKKFKTTGSFESDEAYKVRVLEELTLSKTTIEKELNKQVDYICWPGGGYNDTVIELSQMAGYRSWTLSSDDQKSKRNTFASNPKGIKRIASYARYRTPDGKDYGNAGKYYFLSNIKRHNGSILHKWIGRGLLLNAITKSILTGKKL